MRKAEISSRCANVRKQDHNVNEVVGKAGVHMEKKKTLATTKDNANVKFQPKCYRCGSLEHLAYSKNCPASKFRCSNCGIKGHFAKVCKKRRTNVRFMTNTDETVRDFTCNEESDNAGNVNSLVMNVRSNLVLNICDKMCKNKPVCWMEIGGVGIKIYADSGSPYTIINEELWQYSFVQKVGSQLLLPDIHPDGYGGETIDLLGYRWFSFKFKGGESRGKLYIAKTGPPVLGWFDQKQLHIVLDPNSKEQVLVVDECSTVGANFLKQFRKVFSKVLGNLKGIEHRIILKHDATPKVHNVVTFPY